MTHVSDGDLVRLVDGEVDVAEQMELEGHVDSCEDCAGRYLELRRKIATVGAAIRRGDFAFPKRNVRTWGLRAAALLVALTAVGVTVQPVRAWIVEQTRALWAVVAGGEETAATPGTTSVESNDPTAAVSFVPAGDVFVLEFSTRQASGRLTVETVVGETASATVFGGSERERLVVLPTGLRIVNDSTAAADYKVELPRALARLFIVIGNDDTLRYEPAGAADRWEIDLAVDAGGR
jgi:anti-sigma factor RsiW